MHYIDFSVCLHNYRVNLISLRYNPEIIETLEQYVQFQVDNNTYDFEPNLALMKLYQFRPSRSNVDIAVQVMLKALVVLPKPDFVLLRCILSESLVSLYYTTGTLYCVVCTIILLLPVTWTLGPQIIVVGFMLTGFHTGFLALGRGGGNLLMHQRSMEM